MSVLLWGSSFVATKIALAHLPPYDVVAGRAVLGLAVIALAAAHRGAAADRPAKGDGWRIALLGFLGVPLHLALQAYALRWTSATHGGWLIAMNPVFASILSALFLRECFPRRKTLGLVLGLTGALTVVAGGQGLRALHLPSTGGDALILLSSLNWATYTLVARSLMVRRDVRSATLRSLLAGAVAAMAIYPLLGHPSAFLQAPLEAWLALAFLGVGCSGIGYLAWSAALERMEVGTLSSVQFVQPLVTAGVAWAFLSEPASAWVWGGGALLLSGVALVQRGESGAAQRPPIRGSA